jgi:hypothetical protein
MTRDEPAPFEVQMKAILNNTGLDAESIGLLADGLARELHDLAIAEGIPELSADGYLGLVHDVFLDLADDLFLVRPVSAGHTASFIALNITVDPEFYGRVTEAAKDRMRRAR